ncbi:UNKNOWN [Stylonychia lemnae]|uniref:Uncharacterized protein n=1 Tax=Stylonychia lemnae TaxID=5949 RepID=A0A078ASZ4_STYLE|nr:UNKNOWN [Stylonychia lemnae]|eukprot:CDW85309.1 UNKNOWN [Stylonychia lemnae]
MREYSCMLVTNKLARPVQPTIQLDILQDLINLMTSKMSQESIKKTQAQLKQSFIYQWVEILEAIKTTFNFVDAVFIQHFQDELQAKYDQLTDLKDDITLSDDDIFNMILENIDIKSNNKQFTLAQYCVAKLYSFITRQLWVVLSGQGKSRISAGIAMTALLWGSVTKIHMVFPNEKLKERDMKDFEISLRSTQVQAVCLKLSLYMFHCYLCQQHCGGKGSAGLKFELYSYSFNDAAIIDKTGALMVVVNYKENTMEEKAIHIKELAKLSPLLVYCYKELTIAIIDAGIPPVMIEAGVDYERLQYILGMNDFDYRSEFIPMTLVLAKSSVNSRKLFKALKEWEDSETNAAEALRDRHNYSSSEYNYKNNDNNNNTRCLSVKNLNKQQSLNSLIIHQNTSLFVVIIIIKKLCLFGLLIHSQLVFLFITTVLDFKTTFGLDHDFKYQLLQSANIKSVFQTSNTEPVADQKPKRKLQKCLQDFENLKHIDKGSPMHPKRSFICESGFASASRSQLFNLVFKP